MAVIGQSIFDGLRWLACKGGMLEGEMHQQSRFETGIEAT